MNISFCYDTYQDVRKNLFRYSLPFLIGAGLFTYFFILPSDHQHKIVKLLELVSNSSLGKGLLGVGLVSSVFAVIAFLLTEIFQVHDKWYDRYVIKWRHTYATDFILPRLVQPFACHLNYRFRELAEIHTRDFQEQLFYPFVADRDLKIPKNKLVRFYEAVTVYWLTQINEIVLLMLGGLVVVYRFVGPAEIAHMTKLVTVSVLLAIGFLLNRLWRRHSLRKVRTETEEEIRAIHYDAELKADLKNRLIKLCSDYEIPYSETAEDQYTA
jgi:hypothetical protein